MLLTRRDIVKGLMAAPLLASLPDHAQAHIASVEMKRAFELRGGIPSSVWLRRTTGEEVFADIMTADGSLIPDGMTALSWAMRDYRSNEAVTINPDLLLLMARVQAGLSLLNGAAVPLLLTSGYRSKASNDNTEGAVRNSQHTQGNAADVKAHPFTPQAVGAAVAVVKGGGIGVYPGFCHMDVADARFWRKGRR